MSAKSAKRLINWHTGWLGEKDSNGDLDRCGADADLSERLDYLQLGSSWRGQCVHRGDPRTPCPSVDLQNVHIGERGKEFPVRCLRHSCLKQERCVQPVAEARSAVVTVTALAPDI